MTCESFDTTLDALLEGRCSQDEWRRAEAHVAACARCRRIFDALSGQADDLDDGGHESLAAAVMARTSGETGACASARDRLCDHVDGTLSQIDRELVQQHLAHCAPCSELAAALAALAVELPAFVDLATHSPILVRVLASTSRRAATPSVSDRVGGWLLRAAQRPRFSLEVAYVLTVLLLVVLGNPVDAFREASVRVQPRVSAVAGSVSRPLSGVRAAGAEALWTVERAPSLAVQAREGAEGLFRRLFDATGLRWMVASVQSMAAQLSAWATPVFDSIRQAFAGGTGEPAKPGVRSPSR